MLQWSNTAVVPVAFIGISVLVLSPVNRQMLGGSGYTMR